MGCRGDSRCLFISLCVLQLLTVCTRQVFDFLGFQWTSIIANFCQITVLILGLYGAYQYKRRIIAVYSTWTLIWIGWNIFLICLYLDIGILHLNEHTIALNLAITDSYSWFKNTTFSCDSLAIPHSNEPATATGVPATTCAIDFRYIEVFQSGLQILLACFGFIISCYVIGVLEDDSASFDFIGGYGDRKRAEAEGTAHHLQPLVRSHDVSEEWCWQTGNNWTGFNFGVGGDMDLLVLKQKFSAVCRSSLHAVVSIICVSLFCYDFFSFLCCTVIHSATLTFTSCQWYNL